MLINGRNHYSFRTLISKQINNIEKKLNFALSTALFLFFKRFIILLYQQIKADQLVLLNVLLIRFFKLKSEAVTFLEHFFYFSFTELFLSFVPIVAAAINKQTIYFLQHICKKKEALFQVNWNSIPPSYPTIDLLFNKRLISLSKSSSPYTRTTPTPSSRVSLVSFLPFRISSLFFLTLPHSPHCQNMNKKVCPITDNENELMLLKGQYIFLHIFKTKCFQVVYGCLGNY
jgi:hypothetical protein